MAGHTNMRKHSKIKRCRDEDKKDGRKHPVKDQKFCLWDSNGDKILYAGPSRKVVENQEKAVQYYKHHGSVVLNGQVFQRSLVQASDPGPFPATFSRRTAYSEEQLQEEVMPWLSQMVKYAHGIEDKQDDTLEWLLEQPPVLNQMLGRFKTVISPWNKNKLESFSAAYGDIGMGVVEAANGLQKLAGYRDLSRQHLDKVAPFVADLSDDNPVKALFLEAYASLHLDEAVA